MPKTPARRLIAAALLGTVASALLTAMPADAAIKPKAYKNCTELNKVYPHGVGRAKAKDKVGKTTKPVTTFTKNDKVYKLNDGRVQSSGQYDLDRDNDGIACEKK